MRTAEASRREWYQPFRGFDAPGAPPGRFRCYGFAMRDVLDQVRELQAAGERVAIATVVSSKRSAPRPLGSRLAVSESGVMVGSVSGGCVESDVALRAAEVIAGAPPELVTYGFSDDDAFDVGLPCGGEIDVFIAMADDEELTRIADSDAAGGRLAVTTVLTGPDVGTKSYGPGEGHSSAGREGENDEVFVEHYAPPPVLLIFGAVDTAGHLARIAKQVGFRTVVSDARAKFATPERLPDADEIVVGWPAQAYERHTPDDATYVVTLTHDARFDTPALGPALRSPAPYIGALGSRKAQATRRRRLLEAGFTDGEIDRISGPLGLDIGANSPAETAVSIMAEILATRAGRSGGRLSEAKGRIHTEPVPSA
jgi:xanthine dehydrogenase accessory factor